MNHIMSNEPSRDHTPTESADDAYGRIARAISYIVDNKLDQPELDDVAAHIGISPHHLHRTFSDWAGISPKKFLIALTLADAKARLAESESVLGAALDVGLSGPGRLHDLFVTIDAVTPGEFKSRGAGLEFRYGFHPSPFGDCLIVASPRGLSGLSFVTDGRDAALAEQKSGWENARWAEDAAATMDWAQRIFPAKGLGPAPLNVLLRGTPFRVKVWQALLAVPPGRVVSYSTLASGIGRPEAPRAVAGAIAANLIGYVIPCHRVIRETGAVAGYRWGVNRKFAILGLEAALGGD